MRKDNLTGEPNTRCSELGGREGHDQPATGDIADVSSDWSDILQAIEIAWPADRYRDCGVWVGCSGGADSVALALALAELHRGGSGFIGLVHVNHALRGAESDADEECVKELSERLAVRFHSVRLAGNSADEASLRSQREAAFSGLAHASGARYVAVAHTADDNAETVLHQLFRGTGPAGLAGMQVFRPLGQDVVLARPLLQVRRHQLRQGLQQRGVSWREDASNDDTRYARNWIRHELLPLVESRYSGATARIAATANAQRDWLESIERQAADWLASKRLSGDGSLILQGEVFQQGDAADMCIVIDALRQLWRANAWPRGSMSALHWHRLAATIAGTQTERYTLPGEIDVVANGKRVVIKCLADGFAPTG